MNLSSASKNIEPQEYRQFEGCTRFESVYKSNNLNLLYDINESQKKTVKLIQECSILNLYNNTTTLYKNKTSKLAKPVVEVTVIPKRTTIRIIEVFNKQKRFKKIQNTFSNLENSVQNLNLYPYKGTRRPKVFKVKTSKSDILYYKNNSKYANTTLDHLNMERNIRKNVKTSRLKDIKDKDCFCKTKEDNKVEDKNAPKNRVTIVGQLGLTHDERYVLKCAATVNDKPIPTNFSQVSKSPNRSDKNQDFTNNQTTQATQVNFNFSHNIPKKVYKNQIVQCNCTESKVEPIMSRANVLKESKSPLVIISVYPTQDETSDIDTSPIKIIQHKKVQDMLKVKTQYNFKANEKQERTLSNNKTIRTGKSRSPSPVNIVKNISTKRTEGTNAITVNTRKQSPGRQGIGGKISSKTEDLKKNVSQTVKQNEHLKYKKSKSDVEQVKKALVSNFIRNIERIDKDVSKRKFTAPKDEASKVTINIEGDSENYNVMFERSNFDTGVSVRKTAKVNKKYESNGGTGVSSMENFLMLSDDTADAGHSRKSNYVPKTMTTESKLNVRDSLEISHRRERGSSNLKSENNELKKLPNNDSNFAPVKHFRGDNCSLTDRNDRDREIRELLGVVRDSRKSKISADVQDKNRNCVRTCSSKSIMTGLSITSIFQRKINKNGDNNAITLKQKLLSKEGNYINKFITANELTFLNRISPNSHIFKDQITPQNLILNRNIQVFLQLEQFNKSRPIVLTRRQYSKVKRTIQSTKSKKEVDKNYRNVRNHSILSIGEIKVKPKPLHFDREVQTERTEIKRIARNKKRKSVQSREKESLKKINGAKSINDLSINVNGDGNENHYVENNKLREAASSMEIRYISAEYMKHATHADTPQLAPNERQSFHRFKQDNSIHTIFKGYRRSITPNLGTSAFSLDSNNSIRPSDAGDCKAKKPFLRRLISCLVMRPAPNSAFKPTQPLREHILRTNSSVDSYYINTSLGPIEMSSSLYDTSASFCSNHATYPINKMKRGFFTSVREFLTSRRT